MATARAPPRSDMAESNKRPRSPEKVDRDHESSKRRRKEDDDRTSERRDEGDRRRMDDGRRNGEKAGRERRDRDDEPDDRRERDKRGHARHDSDRRHDSRKDPDRGRDHRNGDRHDPRPSSKQTAAASSTLSSRHKPQPQPSETTANGDSMDVEDANDAEDPLAAQMRRVMGFAKFRSTKNTKVPGNDKNYGVRKEKKTEYRQYMNRVGGFNRPLSPSR